MAGLPRTFRPARIQHNIGAIRIFITVFAQHISRSCSMAMCEYIAVKFAPPSQFNRLDHRYYDKVKKQCYVFLLCVPPTWEYTLFIELTRQGVIRSNMPWQAVVQVEQDGGAWYGGKERVFPEAFEPASQVKFIGYVYSNRTAGWLNAGFLIFVRRVSRWNRNPLGLAGN